jgi:hypothetical protein
MIFETNDKFPFDKLVVGKPTTIPGGNFFIRYSIDESPLYIQPPKCIIKQIQSKSGRKMYCDIIFQQENEQFIRWMESLENKSQKMIYQHKTDWFETPLELEDIEGSFVPAMKIFKAGKSYVVRTNVPIKNGQSNLKIYDEDEKDVSIESVKESMQVMVILEIQGIRCSSSSFQIDIELKQMMILKSEDLFNQFIFKKKSVSTEPSSLGKIEQESEKQMTLNNDVIYKEKESPTENTLETDAQISPIEENKTEEKKEEQRPAFIDTHSNELCEVDFNLDDISNEDTIHIKNRKDMYYKMYQEARQKAKVARDLALSAYLEAKRIKNTYMLDDIHSSSSDEDSDIESSVGEEREGAE